MIFIGGISSGVKQIANEYLKTVICSRCGSYGRYQVYMTYMYFSFFFIPLFKWNKRFYVEMSCCGAVYELDPEVGGRLLRGEGVDIAGADLTLVRDGKRSSWGEEPQERWKRQENGSQQNALPGVSSGMSDEISGGVSVRRCPNCGYEADKDFSYCPKCGTRLE